MRFPSSEILNALDGESGKAGRLGGPPEKQRMEWSRAPCPGTPRVWATRGIAQAGAMGALGPQRPCARLTISSRNGSFFTPLFPRCLSLEPLGIVGVAVDIPLLSACSPLSHESNSRGEVQRPGDGRYTKPGDTSVWPPMALEHSLSLVTGSLMPVRLSAAGRSQTVRYTDMPISSKGPEVTFLPSAPEVSLRPQPEAATGLAEAQRGC